MHPAQTARMRRQVSALTGAVEGMIGAESNDLIGHVHPDETSASMLPNSCQSRPRHQTKGTSDRNRSERL